MSYIFTKGATSQSIELYIVDSTNGTPETGVVFNTAGIDLKYRRKDAAVVSITEAALTTPALTDTWETGGFLEIGNGVYRLDLPDAALASAAGIDRVVVFGTVTGMVVLPVTIHLTAIDLNTALASSTIGTCTTNTDMVGTNSAALASVLGAAVGASISADVAAVKAETVLIVADTSELQTDDYPTSIAAIKAETALIVADTDVIDDATSGLVKIASDVAAVLVDTAEVGAAGAGLTAINLPNQTMDITGNITGNLSGTVGSVTGAVGSVTGHTNQTGDNFAIVNGAAGLVAINTDVEAILDDTGTAGVVLKAAGLNADAVAEIWAAAMSDLAQGAPSATASVLTAINYLYEAWRNKTTTTATLITVMKDDGTTGLVKSTISDDATTFTKGEMVTGA